MDLNSFFSHNKKYKDFESNTIYIITDDKFLLRNYDKKWMIEMDRFTHNLEGSDSETIERASTDSAATMKNAGAAIKE